MTQTARDQARTIIDVIREDHREVQRLFTEAQRTIDTKEFHRLVNMTIAELVRHAVAEEQHLYPAFREYLDDGDELADEELEEHGEMEQAMRYIEQLDADDPELRPAFDELGDVVAQHVYEEETAALPKLRQACSLETLIELGKQMERAKRVSRTRPHASFPDPPPLNEMLDPGAGLVDRVRDALAGRRV